MAGAGSHDEQGRGHEIRGASDRPPLVWVNLQQPKIAGSKVDSVAARLAASIFGRLFRDHIEEVVDDVADLVDCDRNVVKRRALG